jgi:hypothetical protein
MGAQYAIMRFAKYKGPEISGIEAHNERTKEKYASNPDVDTSRSHLNFHLIEPQGKYRAEAEKQIAAAGCRTRTDSVRLVEMLVTASPEFFKDKKREEIRIFFQYLLCIRQGGLQNPFSETREKRIQFQNRNEMIGRNHSVLFILPAKQRFPADHLFCLCIHNGLIKQIETPIPVQDGGADRMQLFQPLMFSFVQVVVELHQISFS